jgi:carbonic anhydrase/acetyltransferase-like protein (isoleucine patch superfamily)
MPKKLLLGLLKHLPNVTIGSNAILAAGAVITKNFNAGDILAGVQTKPISRVDDFAKKVKLGMREYPWLPLIMQREKGNKINVGLAN